MSIDGHRVVGILGGMGPEATVDLMLGSSPRPLRVTTSTISTYLSTAIRKSHHGSPL